MPRFVLRHSPLSKEESINVREFVNSFAECGADTVAGRTARAQKNRFPGSACLQACCHFSGIHRIDARIIGSRGEKDSRVLSPVVDMMIGRVCKRARNWSGSFTVPNSVTLNAPFGDNSTRNMS